jgi:hypothetical protein
VEVHGVYRRILQVEDCTMVGFFLYSRWEVPVDWLCTLLSKISGYHISGRWKAENIVKQGPNMEPIV